MSLYNEKIEALIDAALADGVLTEKEKQILFKKAQAEGIDLDEFEMVLDARLVEMQKKKKQEATPAAPKSAKYGDVRKCPACGAIVPAFQGKCPECGYEFSGVDANYSSTKLAEAIVSATSLSEKKEIIETFPIPNTKSDLLEFLTSLKPRCLDTSDELSKSYLKKYSECVEKAKVAYSDDKMLRPFIDEYAAILSSLKKKQVFSWIKQHKVLVGCVAAALLIGIIGIIDDISSSAKYNRIEKEVSEAIKTGNMDDLLKHPTKYSDISFEQKKTIVKQLLDQNRVEEAATFFDEAGHLSMYDIQWSYHGESSIAYAKTTAELLRNGFYSIGQYEKAWNYYPLDHSDITYAGNAESRYQFMTEAINYILKHDGKDAARQFAKEGSEWFRTHVDNSKSGADYSQFKYQVTKNKFETIIKEF